METNSTDYPFFMATGPRSGFHLLRSLLISSEYVGFVGEFLKELKATDADVLDRFNWIKLTYSHNNLWGTKVHIDLLRHAIRYMRLKDIQPSDIKWIWIRRNNLIAQSVSLKRAIRTGVWTIPKEEYESRIEKNNMSLDFDLKNVEHRVFKLYMRDFAWERFFEESGIEPYTLFYEDFIDPSTWKPVVRGVLYHF